MSVLEKGMKTYLLALKLKFNPALEDAYQSYFASKDKQYIRIAFILFAVLFGLFSITDYILVPERFTFFLTIRFCCNSSPYINNSTDLS